MPAGVVPARPAPEGHPTAGEIKPRRVEVLCLELKRPRLGDRVDAVHLGKVREHHGHVNVVLALDLILV